MIQNHSTSEPRVPKRKIRMVGESHGFLMFLGWQKVCQQSIKIKQHATKCKKDIFGCPPGGMRGATGEVKRGRPLQFGRIWDWKFEDFQ